MPANVTMTASLAEVYILAPHTYGTCWSWMSNGASLHGRHEHSSLGAAVSERQNYNSGVIAHIIDPITAISLGLITVDELRGHYPEGFIALLNMLKVN